MSIRITKIKMSPVMDGNSYMAYKSEACIPRNFIPNSTILQVQTTHSDLHVSCGQHSTDFRPPLLFVFWWPKPLSGHLSTFYLWWPLQLCIKLVYQVHLFSHSLSFPAFSVLSKYDWCTFFTPSDGHVSLMHSRVHLPPTGQSEVWTLCSYW